MEIKGRSVMILGGAGLVGRAVCRRLLELAPRTVVISALTRAEAESAARDLSGERELPPGTTLQPEWGDLFLPEPLKDRPRSEVLADPAARALLLDDLYGELSDDVVRRSALGSLLLRHRPEIIIDCVNTATVFAYQNVFESATRLRGAAAHGRADLEAVESHLTTLYLPQLIRHVQITLEALRRIGAQVYLKVGTSGTGGMGLNVPFTHSEERPSRALLSKAGLAGAHTLLLYLMARTPGAPAVKEVKPTAAISWKRIAFGEIRTRGKPLVRYDAARALPLAEAFAGRAADACVPAGGNIQGVFLDAGENGLFSLSEFEVLTALGLMEYVTPEEIAEDVLREILGYATGRDVVAALDAATSGPTYRAGVLREVALDRMEQLERQHGVSAVAYEMLGPPRLSKLLFEGAILARFFNDLGAAARLDPAQTAERAAALVEQDTDLRVRILSIGLPILLPDGERVLRGPEVKVPPAPGQRPDDPRLVDNGWVDLRPANWRRWQERLAAMVRELDSWPDADQGSRADIEPGQRRGKLRPGSLAAWVFRHEDLGGRIKR
ncbi:MAG: short-chain dehydrogenase [Gemmatimonadetes bacterium]|nr:short-chain dehydrogenase [Gemmatimonadota bacterium]